MFVKCAFSALATSSRTTTQNRTNSTKSLGALLKTLPRLSHATNVLIWFRAYGVLWTRIPWIPSAVASLPSLQTITTESWMELKTLGALSFFPKIKGLELFIVRGDLDRQSTVISYAPPSLSTFRLEVKDDLPDPNDFLSAPSMKYVDISNVQHLALAQPQFRSPFGSWLFGIDRKGQNRVLGDTRTRT
ncbi:hypothetical protein DL96DRAFT_1621468 [Flagelloscypha sp. PMI_526]|nr:hypothetical protein DL96DRAFT_1621468 [Flagelloscypha sp. PMI_526]